jgi:hypothetical protein
VNSEKGSEGRVRECRRDMVGMIKAGTCSQAGNQQGSLTKEKNAEGIQYIRPRRRE